MTQIWVFSKLAHFFHQNWVLGSPNFILNLYAVLPVHFFGAYRTIPLRCALEPHARSSVSALVQEL